MDIKLRSQNKDIIEHLMKKGVDRFSAGFVSTRLSEKDQDSIFFNLAPLGNISDIKDLDKGAKIISDAVLSGDKIAAICDYDSDGCHSAGAIVRMANEMGFIDLVKIFTPDRMIDGYGANPSIVEKAHKWGASVIMTADNGISAFAAAEKSKELGVKFVITDHHLKAAKGLPDADAIIDPAVCGWNDGIVCGATVAFLTMIKVRDNLIEQGFVKKDQVDVKRMFQLIGAATIADCVPLTGVNRSIVELGLKQLNSNPYEGYRAMLEQYDVSSVDEGVIGFKVGPSINAAGRLRSAAPSICFLVTDDPTEAAYFASKLIKTNEVRKEIQMDVVDKIFNIIDDNHNDVVEKSILIYGSKEWHHGVVGIVSSRISEKTLKPSIVFGGQEGDDILKGSGRSGNTGLHMKDLFDTVDYRFPGILIGYGGHAAAAGCSIETKDLDRFIYAAELIAQEMMENQAVAVFVDKEFDLDLLTDIDLTNMFRPLSYAPFGQKFPAPEYHITGLDISSFEPLGKDNKHVSIDLNGIRAVGFNLVSELDFLHANEPVDVIVTPGYNEFRGQKSKQFIIQRITTEREITNNISNESELDISC